MNQFKGIVALPLHVWNRELDSRILLAALAANKDNLVILGHEYNMSPIYKEAKRIFHIGAGRPIYNKLRTESWYKPIIDNGGYVGLIFEEGINDIEARKDDYLADGDEITEESVAATSCVYAWNSLEKELVLNYICPNELRDKLKNKFKIVGNTRIEMCGPIGQRYYEKETESIRLMFGNYSLISDNILPARYADEILLNDKINIDAKNGKFAVNFSNFVSYIGMALPKENIIFRPHPQGSKKIWDLLVKEQRNITIIGTGPILPWIFGSKVVLHSGCSIGMEATLAGKQTVDISKVVKDKRELGQSYKMCTHKPQTQEEVATIIQSIQKETTSLEKTLDNYETKELLDINMKLVDTEKANKYMNEIQRLEMVSSLKEIMKDLEKHNTADSEYVDERIYFKIQEHITSDKPRQEKSRYYTEKQIQERLINACYALNIEEKFNVEKIRDSNVFFIKKI